MVERMEDEGKIVVIRPLKPVAVDRIEKDVQKLTEFYQEGYECAKALFHFDLVYCLAAFSNFRLINSTNVLG